MTGRDGPTPARSGVVLAGGYSRRFEGGDKALATVEGEAMVRRVVDRVGEVVDEVVVNCRADQRPAFGRVLADAEHDCRFAPDPVEDEGPLLGLATGLSAADGDVAAVVACDLPWVAPAAIEALLDRTGEGVAAVPRADGRLQPTHAAYPVGPATEACRTALDDGRLDLGAALERLSVEVVPVDELPGGARSLRDVNTRADLY